MGERGRKRGGQPGNLNALKHGYYSRQFKVGEAVDLEKVDTSGLSSEINMLRVMTRRLFELVGGCGEPEELAGILGTLGTASIRLASLMKTQKLLTGGDNEIQASFREALEEIMKEWNLQL